MFNKPRVLIADPKLIQEITANDAYDFVKPISVLANMVAVVGNGILLSEGENHKRQRKIMNPAFSYNNVKVINYISFISLIKYNLS